LPVKTNGFLATLTWDELHSRPESRTTACTRKWTGIAYQPYDSVSNDYLTTSPILNSTTTHGGMKLAIMVNGISGEPYEFEVVRFFEVLPTNENGVPQVTQSHSDSIGMGLINNFLGSETVKTIGQGLYKEGLRAVTDGFLNIQGFGPIASYSGAKMLEYL
jgi:hypothetical protein